MSTDCKTTIRQRDMPESFSSETCNTIRRIDDNHQVLGVLFLEKNTPTMSTLHDSMAQMLAAKLPIFTELVRNAVGEIDILDDVLAYRIETRTTELLVAPAGDCTACVVHKKSRTKSKHYI